MNLSPGLIERWIAERGWADDTCYDADDEHTEFKTGLQIGDLRYSVVVRITEVPLWVAVKLSPFFIVNTFQRSAIVDLIDAINADLPVGNFRVRSSGGYDKFRYRASASLDDPDAAITTIDGLVDAAIAACCRWMPLLCDVGTSSRAIGAAISAELLAGTAGPTDAVVQQIVSAAERDRRWNRFIATRVSPARSMAAQHAWLDQQQTEFQAALALQGVLDGTLPTESASNFLRARRLDRH